MIRIGLILTVMLYLMLSFDGDNSNECVATWYNMHGSKTASGVKMHRDSCTAAYNDVTFGTKLLVTNVSNNKACVVTVTDKMGCKNKNRIDLSYKAFGTIANHKQGKIKVTVIKLQ